MELTIFFTVAVAANFSINLTRNSDNQQVFFLLEGSEFDIQLSRRYDIIFLSQIYGNSSRNVYAMDITDDAFDYTWPKYINDATMTALSSIDVELKEFLVNRFILAQSVEYIEACKMISFIDEKINYEYIIAFCFVLVILVRSPELIHFIIEYIKKTPRNSVNI